MTDNQRILDAVRAGLRSEPAIDLHNYPLKLELANTDLLMEGELPSVQAKKLALERAAAVRGVRGVVDRLRIEPAHRMGDGAIRSELRSAFLQEPAFSAFAVYETQGERREILRDPPERNGWIAYEVRDGVVTMNGEIPGLGHKRLAGVLAWWIPGSRDVVNGLAVVPPEEDSDGEISDAVRNALEKDGFVDASQIRVSTHDYVVTLEGLVPTESEKDMAEKDAWYVFGVDRVENKLIVRP